MSSPWPDIADNQGSIKLHFFTAVLIAYTYARYATFCGKNLHDITTQADFCSPFKETPFQLACQCSAASLHNTRRTVTKHILSRFDHFRCSYLAEFKTESETGDTLEKSS